MALIDQAEKDYYLLFDFSYGAGAGTHIRYTNNSKTLTWDGETYTTLRTVGVQFPEQSAGVEEGICRVSLPRNAFTIRLSDGLPHSPLWVKITQIFYTPERKLAVMDDPETLAIVAFFGRLDRAIKNPAGKTNSIDLQFKDIKAQLKLPLGVTVSSKCSWPFASEPCGVSQTLLDAYTQVATVREISGNRILVTDPDLNNLGGPPLSPWHLGYVERDGLRIGIRKQVSGTPYLDLFKVPPGEWLDQEVTCFPGCNKTLANCQEWDNEINNGTFGSIMTNYNPNVRSS